MPGLILNFAIAALWSLLQRDASARSFIVGWLVGFALLALFRRVQHADDYVRRTLALAAFLPRFAWSFFTANLDVARTVLARSREQIHPNFVQYDVSGLTPAEIVLLSFFATLTPGTAVAEISCDDGFLVLHVLDASDPDATRAAMDRQLKRPLLAFTR